LGVWGAVDARRVRCFRERPPCPPLCEHVRIRNSRKATPSNALTLCKKNDGPVRRSAKHKSQLRPCTPLSFKSSPHVEKSFSAVAKTKHKCPNCDKNL
jgi:hypothetical protein